MNNIEAGLVVALVGLAGTFVGYVFKAGADRGRLETRVEKLEESTEEIEDLDVRMRTVEQLLPAIATRLESHAELVAELKSDMKAGFGRLEALIGTLFKDKS